MELGRGSWTDKKEDLEGLRQQFFGHLAGYDKVLVLRRLPSLEGVVSYELVEIPIALLLQAKDADCVFGKPRQLKEGTPHSGTRGRRRRDQV
jgi:hypothetical protein